MRRDLMGRMTTVAVAGVAVALSMALHLSMLSGLNGERGVTAATFAERSVPIEQAWALTIEPSEPLAVQGRATVRCRSNGRGYVTDCRWLSESAEGWGDLAVESLNSYGKVYGPEGRVRGAVTFEMLLCSGLCPIA